MNGAPYTLPNGELINSKNTLRSFTDTPNHRDAGKAAPYTLPSGEPINAKNTLQSFDNHDNVTTENVIEGRDPPSVVGMAVHSTSLIYPSDGTVVADVLGIVSTGDDVDVPSRQIRNNVKIFNNNNNNDSRHPDPTISPIWGKKKNLYICWIVSFIVIIGVITGVVVPIILKSKPKPTPAPTNNIVTSVPSSTNTPNINDTTSVIPPSRSPVDIITEYINNITLSDQNITLDGTTAESKALNWIAFNDSVVNNISSATMLSSLTSVVNNELTFRIRQRFALLSYWFQQESLNQVWINTSGWLIDPNECNWYGITCYRSIYVDGIGESYAYVVRAIDFYDEDKFENNNVGGSIPYDFGLFRHIQNIDFAFNDITGKLPEYIGQWTALTNFGMHNNSLTGTLPSSIGEWAGITSFSVSDNSLTGTIPESVGQWTALTGFGVFSNSMNGTLPEFIGQWTSLTALYVSNNFFTGTIPESIGKITTLTSFDVANNSLTGTVPESIGQWNVIKYAFFQDNSFNGTIPNGLCSAATLSLLYADCVDEVACGCCVCF